MAQGALPQNLATTLRLLATLLRPTSGTAAVAGFDVVREAAQVRAQVGFLAASTALYANETAVAGARADFLSTWGDFVSLVGGDPAMNNLPTHYVRDLR